MTDAGAYVLALLMSLLAPVGGSVTAVRTGPVQVGPAPTTAAPSGPCGEWEASALDAGWSAAQWPTLARIMFCESRCDPDAHNSSGASGLLQIMPMHWHGRDPYDPSTNLAIGVEVYRSQGWRAWSCA